MVMISRLLIILIGFGGAGAAAAVTSVISLNPPASNTLMVFVLLMMAFQGVVAIGLIAYGIWRPLHDWMEANAARRQGGSAG